MSYHEHEHFEKELDQIIHIRLQKELEQLHLSPAKKDEIIKQWNFRKKTLWQHCREWGEREISLTFSSVVTAGIAITLFIGGWMLTNNSQLIAKYQKDYLNERPIVYVNIVKNYNGELPLSEQGEMFLRKEYE